jgi:8-oxo-dGTP pyrophosphatase MutT (NUDIX family)
MQSIKRSYGIVCCRPHDNGLQILMVKKSTTYHFCEFVAGHYRKQNHTHLIKLFNNMTYHEKMDILSFKFANMWYRIYMENPDKAFLQNNSQNYWASSYVKKKNKFESSFLSDGGEKLKKLIANSINVDTIWEFPKGRKNESKKEGDVETAMREFHEETGVDESKYKLLWDIKPYIETYEDFGTQYKNTYYFASAIGDWNPELKFYEKQQISEVSSVRWISRVDLAHMNLELVTYQRLLNSTEKIIAKYKNGTKSKLNNNVVEVHSANKFAVLDSYL